MTFKSYPLPFHPRRLTWYLYSILLAAVLFLICSCTPAIETDILIPISINNIPKGLAITGQPLKGLEVRVRGPATLIESLPAMKLQYKLDLSTVSAGVQSVQIKKEKILLPPGISIISITQTYIAVKIENEITKEMPVIASVTGQPASGFIVAGAVAEPSLIVLRGPESTLEPLDKVMTKPINVSGYSESFKKKTAIELIDNLEIISGAKIFIAQINIKEQIVTKKFVRLKVQGRETSLPYTIIPPLMDIELKGPVNLIETIDPVKDINIYIDLKNLSNFKKLKQNVYVTRALIKIPVQTTLSGATPEIFTVKLNGKSATLIK